MKQRKSIFRKHSVFFITLFTILMFGNSIKAQKAEVWLYVTAKDTLFNPTFQQKKDRLLYNGDDIKLKNLFSRYSFTKFKRTLRGTRGDYSKNRFFIIVDNPFFIEDFLQTAPELIHSVERIPKADQKIYEPNDYGLTSTIGENIGEPVILDYMDYLGLSKAWYYTTGNRDIPIGISDGKIDTTLLDFKGKTTIFQDSPLANGHGISQAGNAAAQGDNGVGIPGVCYDCSIYGTRYGDSPDLKRLRELSNAGARVINCSWGIRISNKAGQEAIDEMLTNGTVIVASAGNTDWDKTKGELKLYPASYDNVISVSSAMFRYPTPEDHTLILENGIPYVENIEGYIGRTAGFKDNDIGKGVDRIFPVSIATINPEVDLVSPSVGLFRYSQYALHNELLYSLTETTSGTAPFVSGTIGLMFSLYPCLPANEVESILKMTAKNIDSIEVNKPYAGNYGAGMLQTGDAVEMVFQLYNEKETSYIDNQVFTRWDFNLTSLSAKTVMKNQVFAEASTLKLTAKNQIVLSENSHLKPNENGSIQLKIDPTLEKECELRLRDPSILED